MISDITKNGYSLDLKPLVGLVSRLNGAGGHGVVRIKGMFFRVQDFETSSSRLLRQLYKEGFAAVKYLGVEDDAMKLSEKMKADGIRLHMHTNMGFDTYDLSPMLRHFINDTCRILEPMVNILSLKYPNISPMAGNGKIVSFNQYLKRLEAASISTGLNNAYFYALYDELWNDYKHAESMGIHAGAWHITEEGVIKDPRLSGERLNYLQGFSVEEFINESLKNLNQVLDVTN